jgi:predicted DCC family thiol-disulfide oxidoreductase YuxK
VTPLIIFYDGYCPLCKTEMRHLRKRDKHGALTLVDIQTPEFAAQYPELDWHALNARIHGLLPDGTLITGLDVTHQAWKAVGVGWLYAPLRWPGIRIIADWGYLKFAKHRYTISYLLTGKKRTCDRCVPGDIQQESPIAANTAHTKSTTGAEQITNTESTKGKGGDSGR